MRGVGQPHRADPSVAPGLIENPAAAVEAVVAVAQVLHELALGLVAPAAVLVHHSVPAPNEKLRDGGATERRGIRPGSLRPAWRLLVVRRALEDDRKSSAVVGRQVHVGGEVDAIAHAHHEVAFDDRGGGEARQPGTAPDEGRGHQGGE